MALQWEPVQNNLTDLWRVSVPGGWLVAIVGGRSNPSVAFVPDPDHTWNP